MSKTHPLNSIYQIAPWKVLVFIILADLIFTILMRQFVLTDEFYINSFSEYLSLEQIQRGIQTQDAFSWVHWLSIPFILLAQLFLITLCLNIGALLFNYKVSFKSLFGIVTVSFIVFALAKVIFFFVYLYSSPSSFADFSTVFQFSVLDFFSDSTNWPLWAAYPLKMINLFQILFILLVAYGLQLMVKRSYGKWVLFTLGTYGVGLMIWSVLMAFLESF